MAERREEMHAITAAVINGEPSNHVGITGTRRPPTEPQSRSVLMVLRAFGKHWKTLHHGDCIGADELVARAAKKLGYTLHCHPPFSPERRAFVESDLHNRKRSYLERNRDIVASSSTLIAVPAQFREIQRSGTWATVREARKKGKLIIFCWPDGSISFHGGNLTNPVRL